MKFVKQDVETINQDIRAIKSQCREMHNKDQAKINPSTMPVQQVLEEKKEETSLIDSNQNRSVKK